MAEATPVDLDCWRVTIDLPSRDLLGHVPHSLSADPSTSGRDSGGGAGGDGGARLQGMFWNYLSVGLDAKAAFGFHSLRERKPYLTVGRMTNQLWYSVFSCTSGS